MPTTNAGRCRTTLVTTDVVTLTEVVAALPNDVPRTQTTVGRPVNAAGWRSACPGTTSAFPARATRIVVPATFLGEMTISVTSFTSGFVPVLQLQNCNPPPVTDCIAAESDDVTISLEALPDPGADYAVIVSSACSPSTAPVTCVATSGEYEVRVSVVVPTSVPTRSPTLHPTGAYDGFDTPQQAAFARFGKFLRDNGVLTALIAYGATHVLGALSLSVFLCLAHERRSYARKLLVDRLQDAQDIAASAAAGAGAGAGAVRPVSLALGNGDRSSVRRSVKRSSATGTPLDAASASKPPRPKSAKPSSIPVAVAEVVPCLLYTSDAADD